MALAPDQLAAGAVPTSVGDAFQVTSGKTWQTSAAWATNRAGVARTLTLVVTDASNVRILELTEDIPIGAVLWPIGLGFPVLSTQKIRWLASGASVDCIIGGVKN